MDSTSSFSEDTSKPLSFTRSLVSIWSILAIAIVLRFFQIGAEGVWLDEMYSMDDALNMATGNLHLRPLYYILLRVWGFLGTGDIWLRSLSVLLDLGAIYLAYRLCKFALGRPAALVTALMMSLSPLIINHAQEIRMYALIGFLTLAGSLSMAYALDKPTIKHIGFWAGSRLLSIFASPLMILLLLPDCVLAGLTYRQQWPQLKKFLYGLIFIVAAWSPIVFWKFLYEVFGYVQEHTVTWEDATVDIGLTNTLARLTQFTVFWPLSSGNTLDTSLIPLSYYKVFTLLLVATLAISLLTAKFSLKSRTVWIAAWAFLPLAAQYIACETVMGGTIWRPRYLLYLAPYFIMLVARGFEKIRQWQPLVAIGISVFYLVAVFNGLQFYYSKDFRPPWQDIAAVIQSQEQSGDVVVNYTWMGDFNFPRYYQGDSELITIHMPRRQSQAERLEMVRTAASTLPESDRLWLVCQGGCEDQEEYRLITEAVLGNNPTESYQREFRNVVDDEQGLGGIALQMMTRNHSALK